MHTLSFYPLLFLFSMILFFFTFHSHNRFILTAHTPSLRQSKRCPHTSLRWLLIGSQIVSLWIANNPLGHSDSWRYLKTSPRNLVTNCKLQARSSSDEQRDRIREKRDGRSFFIVFFCPVSWNFAKQRSETKGVKTIVKVSFYIYNHFGAQTFDLFVIAIQTTVCFAFKYLPVDWLDQIFFFIPSTTLSWPLSNCSASWPAAHSTRSLCRY